MNITQLLIGTGNPGKFMEIREILEDLPIEMVTIDEVGLSGDVDETGETHEANALLKARHFFHKTGMPTLAEDSGIIVDALGEELGVHTRRWGAGHDATDEEWIAFFLERMKEFPAEARTARFVCHAALILPREGVKGGEEHVFDGESSGMLTTELEAPIKAGLPLSSVFKPTGYDRVYAGLTAGEKAEISHRAQAVGQVKEFLRSL
jgi:XTP/dITP diphosphohydrolase